MRFKCAVFCVIALSLLASNASAGLTTYSGGGQVLRADDGNPFGLSTSDTVTWAAAYDPSWIIPTGGGFGKVKIGDHVNSGAYLTHSIGPLTFEESDDFYFPKYPVIDTYNSRPYEFDFVVMIYDEGEFIGTYVSLDQEFYFENSLSREVANGVFYNLASTSVPIPPAIWLLGSGLVCLLGLRRRMWK